MYMYVFHACMHIYIYVCLHVCMYVCVCMNLCFYWVPYHSFIHATRRSHDSYVRHTEEGLLQDFLVLYESFICVIWLTHACDRSKTHWRRTSTGYFGTLSIKWDTSSWQLGGESWLLIVRGPSFVTAIIYERLLHARKVCCSVLQCVAAYAECRSVLQRVAVCHKYSMHDWCECNGSFVRMNNTCMYWKWMCEMSDVKF